MTQIILNEEQSRLVEASEGPIVLLDSQARQIGTVILPADDEQAAPVLSRELTDELVRRMSQEHIEWRTTKQVLERLENLRKA